MIAIVFHSVCGNTYLMAREFYRNFQQLNIPVKFFRVKDNNFSQLKDMFPVAKEYYNEINSLEIADSERLLDCKMILLGSPTYFGNVSAEMKAFMDSFADHWVSADFAGKFFASFSTASSMEGGVDNCLQSMNLFAMHMGMVFVPPPANLTEKMDTSAYGLLHISGELGNIRPDKEVLRKVKLYSRYLSKYL